MKFERASGVLLHLTSLPGRYGIGDLGPSAHHFIDWLADSGCKLWQVLPLGPTGYGNSPYQNFSAFAGNPYLISPDFLLDEDLLLPDDLENLPNFPTEKVDFSRVIPWKLNLLERAFLRFQSAPKPALREYNRFCAANASWLSDYALYMALKEAYGGGSWASWPDPLRRRDKTALMETNDRHIEAVERFSFYQFIFFRQLAALREHAHQRGIKIVGDLPIFVAYDSADVWTRPEMFKLDKNDKPLAVAGVPPDYYSPTGQLWGNPLYRWDTIKEAGYDWWIARIRALLAMVDIVRLDHFRGFAGYWEIPANSSTAEHGSWQPGPGDDFFKVVESTLGALPSFAEDLGEITPDVVALRDQFDFPGIKVLQFAFSGPDNAYLPHNFPSNCVVYTGTHDNDTALGWYKAAPKQMRDFALRYLSTNGKAFHWDLVHAAWSSSANTAIAPMQDLLGLGTEARMNYPGTLGGNWIWRMEKKALTDELGDKLVEMNYLYWR